MRVTVLGTGDLTKIPRYTNISEEDLKELIGGLAKLIAKKGHELVIIPDRGIPVEVAKIYKEKGVKRFMGLFQLKIKNTEQDIFSLIFL